VTRPKSYVPPDSRKISVARKAVCVAARALIETDSWVGDDLLSLVGGAPMTELIDAVSDLEDLDPPEYREES